jgi:putative hydrolase of the HAD superfamily
MMQRPFDPPPRAILFDLDDTLCDYSAARETRLRIALSFDAEGNRIEREEDELRQMVAESIAMHPHGTDHFEELLARFGNVDPRAAKTGAAWYKSNRFHGLSLFEGAVATLKAVRQPTSPGGAPRPIGIITNGPTEVQRAKLALLDINGLVDFVFISEEFGAAKPDPSIFAAALGLTGVEPSEAVFVGDTAEFDIAGARDAGMPTVWVNRDGTRWQGPGESPSRTVRHIAEVPRLVGGARL